MKDCTVSMAAADALPVALFCAGGAAASVRLGSPLFAAGILLAAAAGGCKVAWKFLLALRGRDRALLAALFRLLMPCGFALMGASIPLAPAAWAALLRLPSLPFFLLGCLGMLLMTAFAVRLPRESARTNWIEQWTNTAAQALFLAALLLA